jgi:hypothetical protein
MITQYTRLSIAIGLPGMAMLIGPVAAVGIVGKARGEAPGAADQVLGLVYLAGIAAYFVGLALYAKSKGRSPLLAIAGVFGIFGMAGLAGIKDREIPPGHQPARGCGSAASSIWLGAMGAFPFIGLPLGLSGLICGLVGLARAGTRNVRAAAISGIVASILLTSLSGFLAYELVTKKMNERRAQMHGSVLPR